MSQTTHRRAFLQGGTAALAALVLPSSSFPPPPPRSTRQGDRPPPLTDELVHEFVRAAHVDLDKTRSLLREEPALLNATWDWGGGDFETALGGASHMGNREVASFLLSEGARIDLFCAAMMGLGKVVEAVIEAYPDAVDWKGPHGISLLRHAQAGEQEGLVRYLRAKGAR